MANLFIYIIQELLLIIHINLNQFFQDSIDNNDKLEKRSIYMLAKH